MTAGVGSYLCLGGCFDRSVKVALQATHCKQHVVCFTTHLQLQYSFYRLSACVSLLLQADALHIDQHTHTLCAPPLTPTTTHTPQTEPERSAHSHWSCRAIQAKNWGALKHLVRITPRTCQTSAPPQHTHTARAAKPHQTSRVMSVTHVTTERQRHLFSQCCGQARNLPQSVLSTGMPSPTRRRLGGRRPTFPGKLPVVTRHTGIWFDKVQ